LDGNGFAAIADNFGDDRVCAALAGSVVDDHRGAVSRELLGDSSPDAFGGSGDDRDFTGQLF